MTNTITKITYDWDDYKVWAEYTAGTWISITSNEISNTWVTSFNWSTWTVTYTAPVTSVNWNTWAVTVSAVPSVWTNGQVLTVVSWAAAWATPSWWDVQVSTQANNIFTSWMKIWGWTEADYQSLTPDSNTAYLLTANSPTPWWVSINDSFTGNALDTSIWTAEQLGSEGNLTVNNGLTISCGSTFVTGADTLYQGYRIYTNATYQWTETKITAEVTYTDISWTWANKWEFTILWHDIWFWTLNGTPIIDWVTWMTYTSWNSRGFRLCKLSSDWTSAEDSNTNITFSNPTVVKCVLDITNNKSELYINWTLMLTYNSVLSSVKTRSSYVGQPLLTISPCFAEWATTLGISNVKLTTE